MPKENPAKILVVEDENNLRRLFVQYLARQNYMVQEAENGEIALQKIATNDFDLVITDLQMESVSGMEVLQAVKEKDHLAQVLIVTGFGSIATAVSAMQQGAYEYLTKPLHLDALGIKVKNALERRQLLLTLRRQQQKIAEQTQALERDLQLAAQLQASLLPEPFTTDWLRIGVYYQSMIGLGGDYADIYQDDEGNVHITVIDVTGHGIAAALVVNRVSSEVRKLVRENLTPQTISFHLNETLVNTVANSGIFLTMMSIKCEYDKRRLLYSGCGHPEMLLWQHQQQAFIVLPSQNRIIGFESRLLPHFSQSQIPFSKHDRLYVYTDGALEIEDEGKTALGTNGLMNMIGPHVEDEASTAAALIGEKIARYGNGEMGDDVLLLVADFL